MKDLQLTIQVVEKRVNVTWVLLQRHPKAPNIRIACIVCVGTYLK